MDKRLVFVTWPRGELDMIVVAGGLYFPMKFVCASSLLPPSYMFSEQATSIRKSSDVGLQRMECQTLAISVNHDHTHVCMCEYLTVCCSAHLYIHSMSSIS